MSHVWEHGAPAGNWYNKYETKNPIGRLLVRRFQTAVAALIQGIRPALGSVTDVGCGEGYMTRIVAAAAGAPVRAFDWSAEIVRRACAQNAAHGILYYWQDLATAEPASDGADLVACLDVLEHVPEPDQSLAQLVRLARHYLILSVPREPLWHALNLVRGAYFGAFGNTPGHVNHWSSHAFLEFVALRARIVAVRRPVPWTVVLCRTDG